MHRMISVFSVYTCPKVRFLLTLRKHAYSNTCILKISPPQTGSFKIKIRYFFSIFLLRNKAVLTNTYNLCFWAEIRKIMYTPVNSSFTCILCKSVKKGGRTYILLGMFTGWNYLIWLRLWRFANQMRQPMVIICCICKSMIHEARILHSREEWKLSRDTDSRSPINKKIQDRKRLEFSQFRCHESDTGKRTHFNYWWQSSKCM